MLYSTRSKTGQLVSWREAVLSGIAPDGGLYLPLTLPKITKDRLLRIKQFSFIELARYLARLFITADSPLHPEISQETLDSICDEAFNFPLELNQIDEGLFVLELFHGPTCAFKDFGARFMARLFRHFWGENEQQLTVVVATSGDTGSAVANAFLDTQADPPIRVVILYPKGKVSEVQRKQMTTLGYNISAYQVDGTFDDCQALAKTALCDRELIAKAPLTSANSINIARLLPQAFYYAFATLSFDSGAAPIFSIPSGNLGNLTGAILANTIGFQSRRIIAACNLNDTFPRFVTQGVFQPKRSIETISNAMDVGDPSNFSRITELLNLNSSQDSAPKERLIELISAYSISDDETKSALSSFYRRYGYILCPHTAVGSAAFNKPEARELARTHPQVLVATAHPAKFSSTVFDAIGINPPMPQTLQEVLEKRESYQEIKNSYQELRKVLLNPA